MEERTARAEAGPEPPPLPVAAGVERVADDRVASVAQVRSDLVGAAGLGLGVDERAGADERAHREARDRGAAAVADRLRLAAGAGAGERRVDDEVAPGRVAVDQRDVATPDRMCYECTDRLAVGFVALGDGEDTRGSPVETMDDPRTQRTLDEAERDPEPTEGVDQRAGGPAVAGSDRHAGGLVDEGEVRVLAEDRDRDGLGQELGPRRGAEDDDHLSDREAGRAGADGAAVQTDAAGGDEAADLGDGDGEPLGDDDIEAPAAAVHLDAEGRPRIIEVRFEVEEDFHGFRIDHYLKRKIRRLSRTRIQEVVRTQLEVWRDGAARRLKPHSPVVTGDRLVIRRPARPEPPCPRSFGVLYEDDAVVVVDKPAGLPVHASARYHFNTLTRLLAARWPGGGLQIAHRLDRETSGCLVVARGRAAAARLKGAFERRTVAKTYLAIVHRAPEWDERDIDLPLALARPRQLEHNAPAFRIRMEDATGRDDALPASTHVTVVERHDTCALVSCKPVTGRQHQIRAHLAAIGHPIVGDKLYAHGDEAFVRWCDRAHELSEADVAAEFGLSRQALHAAAITFPHPSTGEPLTVTSPLPAELRTYLARA